MGTTIFSSEESQVFELSGLVENCPVQTDRSHKQRKLPGGFSGQWDRWRAEQHAYFLKRLAETLESDGTMLDRSLVLWGSGHPRASHSTKNYPIQIACGNKLGKLHAFEGDKKVPLANLFVSMLDALDVPAESFADSTGPMTELMG